MQRVALDVAECVPVQADVVQVARAVVQPLQVLAAGQFGADAVAQRVVLVLQAAGKALAGACLLRELAQQVVGQCGAAAAVVDGFDQPPGGVFFEAPRAVAFVVSLPPSGLMRLIGKPHECGVDF